MHAGTIIRARLHRLELWITKNKGPSNDNYLFILVFWVPNENPVMYFLMIIESPSGVFEAVFTMFPVELRKPEIIYI